MINSVLLILFIESISGANNLSNKFRSDKILTSKSVTDINSLRKFVNIVERFNMNLSIIASSEKTDETNKIVEEMIVHMPPSTITDGQPTLDYTTMEKYLNEIKEDPNLDRIAARTRTINILEGNDNLKISNNVNANYKIPSIAYDLLTKYQNGVQGFHIPKNHSQEILHHMIIKNYSNYAPSYVDVIQTKIIITTINKSADFPPETLTEIEKVLPELYLWIDDKDLLLRMLVEHLNSKFQHNHQAVLGIDAFAFYNKPYVNLQVANTNLIVFLLKRKRSKI